MAVSSHIILPIRVTRMSTASRFRSSSSKWALVVERSRGFESNLKMSPILNNGRQRLGAHVFVCNSILPDWASIPSGSPDSWKSWVFGLLVTLIFPMWKTKLGPFSILKSKLDKAVQTAEDIAEAVEQVAEKVDKLAEEVSEHLPEGGKLRQAVEALEDLAEETSEKAHLLGDVIDKVQEVEDDLVKLMEQPAPLTGVAAGAHEGTATDAVEAVGEDSAKSNAKISSS